jgi:hypothetical protein
MAERTADFTKVGTRYNFDLSGRLALRLLDPALSLLAAFNAITLTACYQS